MAHLDSLIVFDPDGRTREALVFGFERDGYKVYATDDASDALAMAQTRVPQLVVCGVPSDRAPGDAEAWDLIGRLREAAETRELPIVVVGERAAREVALRAGADEFVAKPAFIRDVLTLSLLAVALRQDGDEQGVAGLLSDYELYFLARALSVAQRTGILELERADRQGEVDFVKGEVVQARCGRMSGVPAFHHLLLWTEAAIQLRMTPPTGERRIQAASEQLLGAGARFAMEFEAMASRVGGAQVVYRQDARKAAEVRQQIPSEVMALLKLYDGRTLIDVIEDSPFKPFDTIKITFRLAELGAIEKVEGPQPTAPLTSELAVRDWLLGAQTEEDRSTVTEAGRRAAEAYAEEEARRAQASHATPPDILDDTARVRTLAMGDEPPAPQPPAPPVPSRRKKRGDTGPQRKQTGRTPKAKASELASRARVDVKTAPTARVELQPSQPPAPAIADFDATIPFSRMPLERSEFADEPAPPPRGASAPVAAPPAPVAAPPAPVAAPHPPVAASHPPVAASQAAPTPAAANSAPSRVQPAPVAAKPHAPAAANSAPSGVQPAPVAAKPHAPVAAKPGPHAPSTVAVHHGSAVAPQPAPATPPVAAQPAPAAARVAAQPGHVAPPVAAKPAPVAPPVAAQPAPVAAKPAPAAAPVAAKPAAAAANGAPATRGPGKHAPTTKQTPKAAPKRETVSFTKLDEEFFQTGREMSELQPVETFDDLEEIDKTGPKRRWFNFGGKKFDNQPKSPKKRR